ncbi:hypothetical protein [Candidatus Electronema sp. TJ]
MDLADKDAEIPESDDLPAQRNAAGIRRLSVLVTPPGGKVKGKMRYSG